MINIINGDIELDVLNAKLTRYMSLSDIRNSTIYGKIREERDMGNSFIWFYFEDIQVRLWKVLVSICYHENSIFLISLTTHSEDDSMSWAEWSEEKEVKKFERNNKFLAEILGSDFILTNASHAMIEYEYRWGKVTSAYDQRSASSVITIKYD